MSVYSKYFTSGVVARRRFPIFFIRSLTSLPPKSPLLTQQSYSIAKKSRDARCNVFQFQNIRFFRWDGKLDNAMSHNTERVKRPHFTIFILAFIGILCVIDWSQFLPKDPKDSWLPLWIQVIIRATSGGNIDSKRQITQTDRGYVPASVASDFYDRHGDIGVDALSEAWQEVKDKNITGPDTISHVFMLAEAKIRYAKEVENEAKELGLENDPEVIKLIQTINTEKEEDVSTRSEKSSKFNLNAEESLAHDLSEIEEDEIKVEKLGFRDRKIIEYENRIRQYSTPDKVFRYFSTYKLVDEKGNHEVMMTPEDFLRSISPGEKQPEHLGLDQYHQISTEEFNNIHPLKNLDESSIFYQLGSGGLISFSDYIFLLTVLSTSRRHFEIAFKMFDLNGDGVVDAEEFEKVNTLLRSSSTTGARHRDHGNTGSTFKGINSGLISYFFGEDKTGTLTVDRFLDFQLKLQEEMLALEFKHKDFHDAGHITERDFADLLIAYAGFTTKKKLKMLRRVKKSYDPESSPGISLKDYLNFYQVLYCINDIDTALTFHTIAGAPIERSTMKHVSKTVAHVELSEHLVDVVFTLFDDNGDGMLSNKEFVSVMKQRAKRGLEKPKEIGISRVFSSVAKCAGDCRPAIMGGIKKTE